MTHKDWKEFYSNDNNEPQLLVINLHSGNYPLIFTKGNFYIKSSQFDSLLEQTNGGGISLNVSEQTTKILIEESLFRNCSAIQNGGAIHKESTGHIVLQRICGIECQTSSSGSYYDGPFCYIFTENSSEYRSYVIHSHITKCKNPSYGYTLALYNGKTICNGVNISRNYVRRCPSILYRSSKNNDTILSYTSITDNEPCVDRFLWQQSSTDDIILNVNFINNTQTTSDSAFFEVQKSMIFINVYIINNTSPLILRSGVEYTFVNCTVTKDTLKNSSFTKEGTFNEVETFLTFPIEHINEEECESIFYIKHQTCQPHQHLIHNEHHFSLHFVFIFLSHNQS